VLFWFLPAFRPRIAMLSSPERHISRPCGFNRVEENAQRKNMFNTRRAFIIAVAICLSSLTARAQINPSHLTGTVKDAQGAVLPGVTVTATSPALLGAQSVTSEVGGEYRFPNLPAGTYTLTFELPGFQTQKRESIVLATAQTLSVDMTLQLASLAETITVTAESPVVDKQSTAVGYVQSTAQLTGVPTSTDLWGALAQTPGVRMGGVDVGGSHKSQQSGYEAFGVVNQARVMTDGVDTTEGTGGAGFYQDFFAQNEIAVSAAGQDVSMNTPGAAIISTIKSGGNRYSGIENFAYEPSSFVRNNVDASTTARGDSAGQPNLLFYEGHADLGGPIVHDKVWFYAAYNHFKINKAVAGVPQNLATDLGIFNNFTTKESYKLSSKDTLIGYYQWGKKQKPLRGIGVSTPAESALAQTSPSWAYNGRWQRTWSNRLFSEVNVGEFGYTFPEQPNVPFATHPPRHDNSTGFDSGAGWFNAAGGTGPFVLSRGKPQVFANVTYFLPTAGTTHDFKFGFEFMNDRSTNTANGTSGPVLYFDASGQPSQVRLTDYGDPATFGTAWTQASDYDRHYAAYGQDRFTIGDRITLTLGARYDHQRPYYSSAIRQPVLTEIWQPSSVPGASLLTADNVAPRAGISWDATGNSKSVVKAFYGRFYFNFADSLAGADPGGPNYKDITFNDPNGNKIYDGIQELGRTASGALDVKNSFGGTSTTVDPNLKNSYTDEFDLSYDRQFWGESAFRVAYVRKMEKNLYTTINTSRIGQYTVPVTVNVPITNYNGGTGTVVGTQPFNLSDLPSSLKGVVTNQITNIPDSLGGSTWTYDTLEFAINKRFGTGLFVNASYDYQWRNDLRQAANNSGSPSPSNSNLSSDPIGVVSPGGSVYFAQVFPAVGPLQKTTTWDAHLSARYEFKYEIGAAVNYSGQSGWPYARLVTSKLPNAGNVAFFSDNLANARNDNIHLLAFRVDKTVTVSRVKITGMFDLFNVLNTNAVTNFNIVNGSKYNLINATVDPRTAQVGIRLTF
jgi:hypothetical protein